MNLRSWYEQADNSRILLYVSVESVTYFLEEMFNYSHLTPHIRDIFSKLQIICTTQYSIEDDRNFSQLRGYVKKIEEGEKTLSSEEKKEITTAFFSKYKNQFPTSYFWVELIQQSLLQIKRFCYIYSEKKLENLNTVEQHLHQAEQLLKLLDPK
jgi:hypothetical protein